MSKTYKIETTLEIFINNISDWIDVEIELSEDDVEELVEKFTEDTDSTFLCGIDLSYRLTESELTFIRSKIDRQCFDNLNEIVNGDR